MISFREKLNKLPQDKVAELELIIGKIVDTGLAEMVILYGSYARGDFKDGKIINVEGSLVQRRSDYDILVVIDQEDDTQEIEKFYNGFTSPKMIGSTEIKIRKALRGMNLPIQIIVEQIGEINRQLEEIQYFYFDIKREGILLYDSGKCQLTEPPEKVTPTIRRQHAEDEFEGWIEQAKVFFENAETVRKKINDGSIYAKNTAFHLEQVCEMCYKCILLVYTHYAADEHNLYALSEEAEKYEPLLKEVFPLETMKQEKLFEKLNLAYIGARYIKNFIVKQDEINYWIPEVEKLLSLTEQSCKLKIETLK